MSTAAFMMKLRKLGVELRVDDDKLVCNAPKSVLTPALRDELSSRKAEFIDFLQTAATVAANDSRLIETGDRDGCPGRDTTPGAGKRCVQAGRCGVSSVYRRSDV